MSLLFTGMRETGRNKYMVIIFIAAAVTGAIIAFPFSYFSNTNVIIGLCLFPFALFIEGQPRLHYRFPLLMLFMGSVAFVYGVRIFYFFALACYILWVMEMFAGRINNLILFLLVFMSPFFHQVTTILGFPLRLQLSKWSGWMLQQIGLDVSVEGNILTREGAMFSVDEACVGLSMLSMAMLMAVFLVIHRYKISARYLGFVSLTLFFAIAFLLNVIANVIRIVILVLFAIVPENTLHELIGLLCLVVYVIAPLYFISSWFVMKLGKPVNSNDSAGSHGTVRKILACVFSVVIVFVGVRMAHKRTAPETVHAEVSFNHLPAEKLRDGITKITTENLLLYIKPIPEFFSSEHTPLMCWKGSGYEFKSVKESVIDGTTIYSGRLVRRDTELYSAWWYSNGKIQTVDQLDWRMRMLNGEDKFCLVNVTAEDEATLMHCVAQIFKAKTLRIAYQSTI